MAFDPGKVSKLQDQLESMAYDWMFGRICTFYGMSEVSELTKEQVTELFEYAESIDYDTYISTVLRSMVFEWEGEHDEDISG